MTFVLWLSINSCYTVVQQNKQGLGKGKTIATMNIKGCESANFVETRWAK